MNDLVDWLMENGGSAIRYRTARELRTESPRVDLDPLAEVLIHSPFVQSWIERLRPSKAFGDLHSSKATAYENVMGKLIQLGCQCGMQAFGHRTEPFRNELTQQPDSEGFSWTPFQRMIVGSFLVAAGYGQEPAVQEYMTHRLDTLWRFTREMDYDIFADRSQYPSIPKGFHDKPLVKPELYPGGDEHFPTIYDINALANYPSELLETDTQDKIKTIVAYILDPRYQAFPEGYGLMRAGKRKYHAIGWSVHLPGFPAPHGEIKANARLVQRLVLMSHFRTAREHRWFQEHLEGLEAFRTPQGTYRFPRSFLQERSSGYWVTGAYMGLEENRRKRIAIELESTFWMMKLKKNTG